jgi:hypothetical protein
MSKLLARSLPSLWVLLWVFDAVADEPEQPMETSTTGVVIFFLVAIICIGLYVWYTVKGEKKSKDNKEGDKS